MTQQPFDHMAAVRILTCLWRSVRQRAAGVFPPMGRRPHLSPQARLIWAWVGIGVGLIVQLVLLWLMWQLVDLCISLMEVWAELAAKHLRIMLDVAA